MWQLNAPSCSSSSWCGCSTGNITISSSSCLTRCVLLGLQGIYDPKSKLVFRALAVKERRLDDALIASRLQRALQLRQRLFKGSRTTGATAPVQRQPNNRCDSACSKAAEQQVRQRLFKGSQTTCATVPVYRQPNNRCDSACSKAAKQHVRQCLFIGSQTTGATAPVQRQPNNRCDSACSKAAEQQVRQRLFKGSRTTGATAPVQRQPNNRCDSAC
jgi:hypothetical protein